MQDELCSAGAQIEQVHAVLCPPALLSALWVVVKAKWEVPEATASPPGVTKKASAPMSVVVEANAREATAIATDFMTVMRAKWFPAMSLSLLCSVGRLDAEVNHEIEHDNMRERRRAKSNGHDRTIFGVC